MEKKMDYGLVGMKMDRRNGKKLTRMVEEMGNRLCGMKMD